jgi:hypothetical protein
MTLNELHEQTQQLIDAGFGKCQVIKASDDEGNDFISVGNIQNDRASGGPYRFEVLAAEDYDAYEEGELKDVICIW